MVNEKLGIVASAGWVLPVIAFLGVASANAQEVTWLRNLEVNQPVPDLGQSVSLLDMANSGMASISDLKVDLSLSSSAENNLMWLGQVYVSLTYGVASEEERTAVLLNRPGVSSSIFWAAVFRA